VKALLSVFLVASCAVAPKNLPPPKGPTIEVHTADVAQYAKLFAAAQYIEALVQCDLWAGVYMVQAAPFDAIPPEEDITHVFFMPKDEIRQRYDDNDYVGYAQPAGGWKISIADDIHDGMQVLVSIHELAHSLDGHHVEENTLLHPTLGGETEWTFDIVNELHFLAQCLD
jgi:hypothetical protein